MSYNWTHMAVQGKPDRVLESLQQYFGKLGGSVDETTKEINRSDRNLFRMFNQDHHDWSLIEFYDACCVMPQLIVHISSDLSTRVMTNAEYEAEGYEHFSMVENGKPSFVFTYCDDICDQINVDLDAMMKQARSDPRWEQHGLERYEKIERDEYASYAGDVLMLLHCPRDLYQFFTFGEAPEAIARNFKNYEIKLPKLDKLQLDGTEGRSWKKIMSS